MDTLIIKESNSGVSFAVRAVPRASRNALGEVREGALVVRLVAPPVEGKANSALVAYLSQVLGVRKGQVSLAVGEKSRHKVVVISGINAQQLRVLLDEARQTGK